MSTSSKVHNVFISWSGERSFAVAQILYDWLPMVLQSVVPWKSDSNIEKGSQSMRELSEALETISVGITCLTPENLAAPWIMFEAGALSKSIGAEARLCTYLVGGLKRQDISGPLAIFQHTRSEKDDTFKLLTTLNNTLNKPPISTENLKALHEAMWPALHDRLVKVKPPTGATNNPRSLEDMVGEILDWTRSDRARNPRVQIKDIQMPNSSGLGMDEMAGQLSGVDLFNAQFRELGGESSRVKAAEQYFTIGRQEVSPLLSIQRRPFGPIAKYDMKVMSNTGVRRLMVPEGKSVAEFLINLEEALQAAEVDLSPGADGGEFYSPE